MHLCVYRIASSSLGRGFTTIIALSMRALGAYLLGRAKSNLGFTLYDSKGREMVYWMSISRQIDKQKRRASGS